ncbi:MAG: sugar phosphate isomerase/epimerase family protein [Lachnospirales bacterium]
MGFGMRGHDLGGKQKFEEFLAKVKANNIDLVQLAFQKSITDIDFTTGHYSAGLGHYIGKRLSENNIHVAVLGCYINPTTPDEDARKANVKRFIEHLKYARAIGADMVGTETGRLDENFKIVPGTYTETCYQRLLKSMREIVDAAEKLGVIVGVEGVATHTLYSPEMMQRFLDDINSPNVEVILDPVNLLDRNNYMNQEEVIDKAFKYYGDRISVMHIKDFKLDENGDVAFEQVGDGLFHYAPLFKHLKNEKPYITMLIENSSEPRYKSDCEYLQKIYDEA